MYSSFVLSQNGNFDRVQLSMHLARGHFTMDCPNSADCDYQDGKFFLLHTDSAVYRSGKYFTSCWGELKEYVTHLSARKMETCKLYAM